MGRPVTGGPFARGLRGAAMTTWDDVEARELAQWLGAYRAAREFMRFQIGALLLPAVAFFACHVYGAATVVAGQAFAVAGFVASAALLAMARMDGPGAAAGMTIFGVMIYLAAAGLGLPAGGWAAGVMAGVVMGGVVAAVQARRSPQFPRMWLAEDDY